MEVPYEDGVLTLTLPKTISVKKVGNGSQITTKSLINRREQVNNVKSTCF
jgi:hypothetical protein